MDANRVMNQESDRVLDQILDTLETVAHTIYVKAQDPVAKATRETTAQRVVAQFGKQFPDGRLLCFLDDVDHQPLKDRIGAANRGFCEPLSEPLFENTLWFYYPDYLKARILVEESSSLLPVRAFDHVIYLHGSACSNEVGLAITFAHELQHFVQYVTARKLWAQNRLVPELPRHIIEHLHLNWFDIPSECEARIVSIRIAKTLFGSEPVREFMNRRVAEAIDVGEVADSEFIRGLVGSVPASYDLAGETEKIFGRLEPYKQEFANILENAKANSYFADITVNTLFKSAIT
jgi:hypothetical protein